MFSFGSFKSRCRCENNWKVLHKWAWQKFFGAVRSYLKKIFWDGNQKHEFFRHWNIFLTKVIWLFCYFNADCDIVSTVSTCLSLSCSICRGGENNYCNDQEPPPPGEPCPNNATENCFKFVSYGNIFVSLFVKFTISIVAITV